MGLIPDQQGLTVLDPAFEAQRRRTYPGMAHFAGTGPAGKVCRECVFWTGCGGEKGYYAPRERGGGGLLKPRSCLKHKGFMCGQTGPGIPYEAAACRYFEQSQEPPSITDKS